jgi:hypothetical protein
MPFSTATGAKACPELSTIPICCAHLADELRRKRANDGIAYAIRPDEVHDTMRRYEVGIVEHQGR